MLLHELLLALHAPAPTGVCFELPEPALAAPEEIRRWVRDMERAR